MLVSCGKTYFTTPAVYIRYALCNSLKNASSKGNNAEYLYRSVRTQGKNKRDGFDTILSKYRIALGRSAQEIREMESRLEAELLDILTLHEKKSFRLNETLIGSIIFLVRQYNHYIFSQTEQVF